MITTKDKNIRLLNTAKGQIDGLVKMVESERYCIDISNQLLASIAILKKVNNQILQDHLRGCVIDSFSDEHESVDEKISEIISVIEKLSK
ncbi:MAG: metal-sensing transcriptional repressor [Bacilli bacterium]